MNGPDFHVTMVVAKTPVAYVFIHLVDFRKCGHRFESHCGKRDIAFLKTKQGFWSKPGPIQLVIAKAHLLFEFDFGLFSIVLGTFY